MSLKIAVGGIKHESNGFATFRTTLVDFKVKRGSNCIPEFLREGFSNIGFIPTILARALPGGWVSRKAYEELKSELLVKLEYSMPLDGVFLDLHGAMEVEGLGSGETDLLKSIREVVGWEVPIAVSLDLHGNVTPELVKLVDILTAYRTAPHIDYEETCLRAVMMLVKCVKKGMKPTKAIVKIPFVLPGERAVTLVEPAKSLYRRILEYKSLPKIMDLSFLIGCVWTDSPYSTMTVLVLSEKDRQLALRICEEYAKEVWQRREEFNYEVEALPFKKALKRALEISSQGKPIIISDSGDNITAGAAGDTNICLAEILEANVKNVLIAGIYDYESVLECFKARKNSVIKLEVGGKLDNVNCKPLEIKGEVLSLRIDKSGVKLATIRTSGVDVILTSRRKPFDTLKDFYEAGVDPENYDIIIIKAGYLPMSLRVMAYDSLLALTPGFTDQVIERLTFKNLPRPVYPLDMDFEWRPEVILYDEQS